MKKSVFVFLFPFLLLFCSCSDITENQKALVGKKWYCHNFAAIEFKRNNSYIIYYQNDTPLNLNYEFLEENKFRILFPKNEPFLDYFFMVKDSILYTLLAEDSLRNNSSFDTTFYHLSPKYEPWQVRELFYHGKIISEKDPNPIPPIYSEF